jgi:beta-1,4-mannosyltransferase
MPMMPLRIAAWPAFKTRHRNPYNFLLYRALSKHGVEVHEASVLNLLMGRHEIWHIHWPDLLLRRNVALSAVRVAVFVGLMKWVKMRGTRIVWTIHNLRSHEKAFPRLEHVLWRCLLSNIDAHISLTNAAQRMAVATFPSLAERPGFVVPHGHYRDNFDSVPSRKEARRELGLSDEARTVTFIGMIRPYKNVPALVRTFRQVIDPDARLIVAGEVFDKGLERDLRAACGDDPRIALRLGYLSDATVANEMRASNVVVLPYRDVLNSGTALLALSFDAVVLVPRQGSLVELGEVVGESWVRFYGADLRTEDILDALNEGVAMPDDARAPLEQFDWGTIAARTVSVYRAALSPGRPVP